MRSLSSDSSLWSRVAEEVSLSSVACLPESRSKDHAVVARFVIFSKTSFQDLPIMYMIEDIFKYEVNGV